MTRLIHHSCRPWATILVTTTVLLSTLLATLGIRPPVARAATPPPA